MAYFDFAQCCVGRRSLLLATLAAVVSPVVPHRTLAAGRFKGPIVTEWLEDGRLMKLREPFEFVDYDGRRWPVPAGIVVDGASIPEFFWSLIGGPFEGLYRVPSVIHDFYCEKRTRTDAEVHLCFYQAMRTAGVSKSRAWLMYQAVVRFGPKWDPPTVPRGCDLAGEDYDFDKCAQNSLPPEKVTPPIGNDQLREFLQQNKARIDSDDYALLSDKLK
jgi:Protein of unknown function (DUF1353)